jgi:hypothetical protein
VQIIDNCCTREETASSRPSSRRRRRSVEQEHKKENQEAYEDLRREHESNVLCICGPKDVTYADTDAQAYPKLDVVEPELLLERSRLGFDDHRLSLQSLCFVDDLKGNNESEPRALRFKKYRVDSFLALNQALYKRRLSLSAESKQREGRTNVPEHNLLDVHNLKTHSVNQQASLALLVHSYPYPRSEDVPHPVIVSPCRSASAPHGSTQPSSCLAICPSPLHGTSRSGHSTASQTRNSLIRRQKRTGGTYLGSLLLYPLPPNLHQELHGLRDVPVPVPITAD